jgi:hypothetical protein
MDRAIDTRLDIIVWADTVAWEGEFEPYRYECACCGETVHIAAIDSEYQRPHFRHLHGNSDKECELYLGRLNNSEYNNLLQLRKNRNASADFYFDLVKKMFYIGLIFDEDEICNYERNQIKLELKISKNAHPFKTVSINNINFFPNERKLISIEQFSYSYFFSTPGKNLSIEFQLFKSFMPSFFKVQSDYSKARFVRDSVLYTNTQYFVTFPENEIRQTLFYYCQSIIVEQEFRFKTMGQNFKGLIITFTAKDQELEHLLNGWGLRLEASEKLTLLWPPSSLLNETIMTTKSSLYIFSTFSLKEHANINVDKTDIFTFADGKTSKIKLNSKVKIFKKNTEMTFLKRGDLEKPYEKIIVDEDEQLTFKADDNNYFLFNNNGVTPLVLDMNVTLTKASFIKHFKNGYQDKIITTAQKSEKTTIKLEELLLYYKRTERFQNEDFESLNLSESAKKYIDSCKIHGVINVAAKRLIQQGLL